MRLVIDTSPTNPRDALRETKSADGASKLRLAAAHDYNSSRLSSERMPTLPSRTEYDDKDFSHGNAHGDDEIQMTFDTAYPEESTAPPAPPPKDPSSLGRPDLRTAQTVPNLTLADPWADEDDEDFGKEKEISMTFA